MSVSREDLTERLRERLSATHVEVEDESGRHAGHAGAQGHGGGHYRVKIESPLFAGQTTAARHRMVYEALKQELKEDIHALSIQAMAPVEKNL